MSKQLKWFKYLKPGSQIRKRGQKPRTVRSVQFGKNNELYGITLSILRCSWTHRCYTVLNANDLIQLGYQLHQAKPKRMRTKLDHKIKQCISNPYRQPLDCCDVVGVVR